jgi:hypothetical protein
MSLWLAEEFKPGVGGNGDAKIHIEAVGNNGGLLIATKTLKSTVTISYCRQTILDGASVIWARKFDFLDRATFEGALTEFARALNALAENHRMMAEAESALSTLISRVQGPCGGTLGLILQRSGVNIDATSHAEPRDMLIDLLKEGAQQAQPGTSLADAISLYALYLDASLHVLPLPR